METLISYAQNREDLILNALLKDVKNGFYVDVGANHPVHESVTKLFYDQGWHGINVEPSQRLHNLLEVTRPRDINLQVGVSDRQDELVFREYTLGDGLSTFSDATQEAYDKDEHYRYFASHYVDHKVPVTTLRALLAEHAPKVIDFMKIDVEGYEYEAVAGNDWAKYRPTILCIEANHIVKDWHPIFKKANYELVFWDGLNEYFVAAEKAATVKDFSYADSMYLGTPFVTWSEFNLRRDAATSEALLKYQLRQSQQQVEQLQQALASRGHARPRSPLVKRGLRKVDRKIEAVLGAEDRPSLTREPVVEPTSEAQLVDSLRAQLRLSVPNKKPRKAIAVKSYRLSKRVAVKAVRKGRRS